jgi:hypothetical protein
MILAMDGKRIPIDRALATFADEKNWVRIYNGTVSPIEEYKPKACNGVLLAQ